MGDEDEFLLVKHAYGPTKGRWDFIRGYIEADEILEEAAVREVAEETSVHAVPITIIGLRHQASGVPRRRLIASVSMQSAVRIAAGCFDFFG